MDFYEAFEMNKRKADFRTIEVISLGVLFIVEVPLDEEKLKKVIHETGYEVLSVKSEPFVKRGLFKW